MNGSSSTELLSFSQDVAVLEKDPKRMRFIYNALRLQSPEEVKDFNPELVINCVTLSYTIEAFKAVMPYLQPYCIISDIASVKTYLKEFYETYEIVSRDWSSDVCSSDLPDLCQSEPAFRGECSHHQGG